MEVNLWGFRRCWGLGSGSLGAGGGAMEVDLGGIEMPELKDLTV